MNILLWHVHGAWTDAFVRGDHRYVVPVLPDRGPDGRGRAQTYPWPDSVVERSPEELGDEPIDVVVLQRPEELGMVATWTGREPGVDLPAVFLEHNAPQGRIAQLRHLAADLDDVPLVHVTPFNALLWDAGDARVRVIEHGIPDPGHRYAGRAAAAIAVINEPERRGRVTGTDLLGRFAGSGVPVDLAGIDSERVGGLGDLPHAALLEAMAERRVYLHPVRWTSLGLSLIEAMHLGMPVVALRTTGVPDAVPAEAGILTTDVDALVAGCRRLLDDPLEARQRGVIARAAARERFGLERFLADWDAQLLEVAA